MIRQLKEIDKAMYAVKVGLLISDFPGVYSNIGKAFNFLNSLSNEVKLRESLGKFKKEDSDYEKAKSRTEKDLL